MPFLRPHLFQPAVLVALVICEETAHGRHLHVNAGAEFPVPGSQLFFSNGSDFDARSGYVIQLSLFDSPNYGSIFYGGSDITFTSLPATPDYGGPERFAALLGTHIEIVFETLDGPVGGSLSFWDSFDGFFDATEITSTIPVPTVGGTEHFSLSENDGSAGVDPYGHIHGRKFSADRPGLYTVGFRLVDTAHNGPGGGPLHSPSDIIPFYFQAGITLSIKVDRNNHLSVQFATEPDLNYYVETSTGFTPAPQWTPLLGPIPGTGRMETLDLPEGTTPSAFFRLRVE